MNDLLAIMTMLETLPIIAETNYTAIHDIYGAEFHFRHNPYNSGADLKIEDENIALVSSHIPDHSFAFLHDFWREWHAEHAADLTSPYARRMADLILTKVERHVAVCDAHDGHNPYVDAGVQKMWKKVDQFMEEIRVGWTDAIDENWKAKTERIEEPTEAKHFAPDGIDVAAQTLDAALGLALNRPQDAMGLIPDPGLDTDDDWN
jgi:hypothetical protein